MKAIYKGKVKDRNGYATHLFYEYRGHEYMITDENNGYSEPLWVKHKSEQARIDQIIDSQFNPSIHTEPAEIGINKFFEYCETGDESVFD